MADVANEVRREALLAIAECRAVLAGLRKGTEALRDQELGVTLAKGAVATSSIVGAVMLFVPGLQLAGLVILGSSGGAGLATWAGDELFNHIRGKELRQHLRRVQQRMKRINHLLEKGRAVRQAESARGTGSGHGFAAGVSGAQAFQAVSSASTTAATAPVQFVAKSFKPGAAAATKVAITAAGKAFLVFGAVVSVVDFVHTLEKGNGTLRQFEEQEEQLGQVIAWLERVAANPEMED